MDDGTMASTNEAMALIRATDADPRGTVLMLLRVLGSGLATATRERDEARAENERLHAIIEGRTVAPTDAELAAHAGAWLMRLYNGALVVMRADVMVSDVPYVAHWWPLTSDGRPCACTLPVPPCPEVSR